MSFSPLYGRHPQRSSANADSGEPAAAVPETPLFEIDHDQLRLAFEEAARNRDMPVADLTVDAFDPDSGAAAISRMIGVVADRHGAIQSSHDWELAVWPIEDENAAVITIVAYPPPSAGRRIRLTTGLNEAGRLRPGTSASVWAGSGLRHLTGLVESIVEAANRVIGPDASILQKAWR